MTARALQGIRKANDTAMVSLVSAATPVTLWNVSTSRTAVIKKIMIAAKGTVGNATVQIGTGLGGLFVFNMPDILVIGAANPTILVAAEIPGIRYDVDITVNILAVTGVIGAAPNDVVINIEVAELK